MKEYTNSDARIVSVIVPEDLNEMSGLFGSAFSNNKDTACRKNVALVFSPSNQRAALLSRQRVMPEQDQEIRKIFPKYGWSVEQEAEAMPGIVIVPDENTSPNQVSARVAELIEQFN